MADGQLATKRKSTGRPAAFLRPIFLALLILAGGAALEAQEKEFHWTRIEVHARLLADGSISVRERQHYLFTGDYNGGARGFDLRMRQRLDFRGISRQQGESWIALTEGDLSAVDQYSWTSGSDLRWRSRLPSDPPFDRTALVYQLEYRITNVVFPRGELFALDHDFLFPDREAVVERFDLDLEVDPSWQVRGEWQRHHSAGPLVPGESYVVHLDLEWSGAGEAPVHRSARPFLPALLLILLGIAGGMGYLIRDFFKRQAALGRFQPVPALPQGQEKAWLEQYLLPLRAEEVGAFWDRKVGPPEVAALIARWVAEGKVRSRVEEKAGFLGLSKNRILHLEQLADRSVYEPYERELIDDFFFGRRQVDTEAIRQHYKSTGFDPAGSLRKGLEERLAARPGWEEKKERAPAGKPTLLLFLAGLAALFADFLADAESALFSFFFYFLPLIPLYIVPAILGFAWRSRVEKLGRALFFLALLPAGYFSWLSLFALTAPVQIDPTMEWSPGYFGVLGYGLLLLGILRSVLNMASSRETAEGIGTRQWLAGARNYLAQQLRRPEPTFSDVFFPYLLAFGLDKDVDRWFRSFGGAAAAAAHRQSVPAGGYSGGGGSWTSSGGGGFTGGGGMFGGGGASASWAAAATAVASGVAAPSSSSSGGGSSGGSSSGGGSGGAW